MSMNRDNNGICFINDAPCRSIVWQGDVSSISFDYKGIKEKLLNLESPCYVLRKEGAIGIANEGELIDVKDVESSDIETLAAVPPLVPNRLGSPEFLRDYGVKYAYIAGSMANGISSEQLVTAMGNAGFLSSFGSGGLLPSRIEDAIYDIQKKLSYKPYMFNLLHSPYEPSIERKTVEIYLKNNVKLIEASAFLNLTPYIVYYRAAGLSPCSDGSIKADNKIIAKVSRREVAAKFLKPAPYKIIKSLVEQGLITDFQAKLAEKMPMADDITAEADSGGHTDNRPLVSLLPSIMALRDEIEEKYDYKKSVRIGAAGGIGTPQAALAAFMMGADYILTGSVIQSCVESGTSVHVKGLLAKADMADVMMAPAADMFEMGVKLQTLKSGTLFPMRAEKLYNLYKTYDSIEDIPLKEREKIEKEIFRKKLDEIWNDTVEYFNKRDAGQIDNALNNPKKKMALIFRWYLGLSSRWANIGEKGREMDYQIWCGPVMGAFNDWVKGSYLENPEQRGAVDVSEHIMKGAAFLYRLNNLKLQGLSLPATYRVYTPIKL